MHILVLNSGSSSLKADVINTETGARIHKIRIERITESSPILNIDGEEVPDCPGPGHAKAIPYALELLLEKLNGTVLHGIGHRVVHGGSEFSQATEIDTAVVKAIEGNAKYAPLHNPVNLEGIRSAQNAFPDLPHIAVFDTAFHQTLPRRASTYAIPAELTEKHGIRRFGFHGTSHQYVARKAAEFMQTDMRELRIISCHLGSGCSIAAVEYGRSVETSMGMTPLEGLVMGTRSGDVDPGVLTMLMERENLGVAELEKLLNKESGLKGLAGDNDMRDIIERASKGDDHARQAIQVFSHRVKKYIGAYSAVMGGVDAIVFTGGIGENSRVIRRRICERLEFLGALMDEDLNNDLKLSDAEPVSEFSIPRARCRLLAIATDEQLSIARQTAALVAQKHVVNTKPTIPIAVSARHVHLTQETVEILFGKGYALTEYKPLSQPGQFAANERVTLVGPRNEIENVRILGPVRSKNQVEISRTDEFVLGIDAPVRESGKVENTPGITLIGPEGRVDLKEGLICAWRHIHMTPEDARVFGVKDRDVVEVEVTNNERSLVFGDVLIRVSPKYKLEMHIDTDEGNAAEISRGATGALVAVEGDAHLRKKRVSGGL